MDAVFKVNEVFIGRGILQQGLTRPSGDRLVSFVDIQSFLGPGVDHPEDLPNVACHLLEPLLAFAVLPERPDQESRAKENHGAESC